MRIVDIVLDLVYPRRCPVCGSVLRHAKRSGYICPLCRRKLHYVEAPQCLRCGKHIESSEQEYCEDCMRIPKHFTKGFPVFVYEGALKNSLLAFKYKNKREYAAFYAEEIVGRYGTQLAKIHADAWVPVPVHRKRYRKRGYNQAALIAKELSKRTQIPCYEHVLVRIVQTHVQKTLNDKQRYQNLKNAFKCQQNSVKLRKVILVDDIYTTGATIEACTRELLRTGVEQVYYVSVSIGEGRS